MKIEEHGGKYRVRKMVNGALYIVNFDHKPTQKEIKTAISDKMREEGYAGKGSFKYFAKKYINNREKVVSPNTIRTYNTKLNQLSTEFCAMSIHTISSECVQAEINRLAEKLEPKTVKTTYGFITAVLRANRSVVNLKVKLPQAVKKDKYEPTNEDIRRILEEVRGTEYSVAFQLAAWGVREGEICALTMDDLEGNKLHIHRTVALDQDNKRIIKDTPKTEESNRILPLPPQLADEIRQQGFIYDKAPNRLNKKIHDVQKKLGIPPFKFHALRSYFASYAHSLGICEADILALGGWKTASVMRSVYRKSIEESKEEAVKKIMVKWSFYKKT